MTKLPSSVLIKQETLCVPALNIADHQPHREQLLPPPYQLHQHPQLLKQTHQLQKRGREYVASVVRQDTTNEHAGNSLKVSE